MSYSSLINPGSRISKKKACVAVIREELDVTGTLAASFLDLVKKGKIPKVPDRWMHVSILLEYHNRRRVKRHRFHAVSYGTASEGDLPDALKAYRHEIGLNGISDEDVLSVIKRELLGFSFLLGVKSEDFGIGGENPFSEFITKSAIIKKSDAVALVEYVKSDQHYLRDILLAKEGRDTSRDAYFRYFPIYGIERNNCTTWARHALKSAGAEHLLLNTSKSSFAISRTWSVSGAISRSGQALGSLATLFYTGAIKLVSSGSREETDIPEVD